jgi:hypothetical protein
METRFGYDFSRVRVFSSDEAAESARAVNALAYTVGQNIVFGQGRYAPATGAGRQLLAHELAHAMQQPPGDARTADRISQPGDPSEHAAEQLAARALAGHEADRSDRDTMDRSAPSLQRQVDDDAPGEGGGPAPASATADEGIEVGNHVMLMPRPSIALQPVAGDGGGGVLSRQEAAKNACATPTAMRKVISGKFEGGKTLDDYYPDLVGTTAWGAKDKAGPFDNGTRAGSSVQLIGEYAAPCAAPGPFTLGQSATIVRMRGDGKKLLEQGKPLEGRTLDDIARSKRDASKPPFRQEFGFAISMADPISGAPYSMFTSYELEVNLTSSLTGPGGGQSVNWGVTVESKAGKITKNEVR